MTYRYSKGSRMGGVSKTILPEGGVRLFYSVVFMLLYITATLVQTRGMSSSSNDGTLILQDAKIYRSPTVPPIEHGSVTIRDGKIVSVEAGTARGAAITAKVSIVNCTGRVITAGFQNSHIHLTEPKWDDAAHQSAAKLAEQLRDMLTRYGVTTAVDLSSFLPNTTALRARVESGEIAGPRILTAGSGLFPLDGLPFYVRESLPPEIQKIIPQPSTPQEAVKILREEFAGGSDVVKLFTGSLVERDKVKPMPVDIARAAVGEAHRNGKLVFTHPSNFAGIQVALDAHVDVLAHTTPIEGPWSEALIAKMLAIHMSLIPTLKLWEVEAAKEHATPAEGRGFAEKGARQLGEFSKAGGQVLFGTDVGYITDYDPTEEYILMRLAGLTPMQILASLTITPAARFGETNRRGTIAPGQDADLVILDGDPAQDVANFAKVHSTIRSGRIIYDSSTKSSGGSEPVSIFGDLSADHCYRGCRQVEYSVFSGIFLQMLDGPVRVGESLGAGHD
jgi:imidazolonepropionase-like amidohydrolase